MKSLPWLSDFLCIKDSTILCISCSDSTSWNFDSMWPDDVTGRIEISRKRSATLLSLKWISSELPWIQLIHISLQSFRMEIDIAMFSTASKQEASATAHHYLNSNHQLHTSFGKRLETCEVVCLTALYIRTPITTVALLSLFYYPWWQYNMKYMAVQRYIHTKTEDSNKQNGDFTKTQRN